MIRLLLCLSLLCLPTLVRADDDPLAPLKKGQPRAVANMVERIVGCSHWAGEEPYDAERKKEIAQALKELRCDRLDRDYQAMTKRYAKRPKVLDALQKAREFAY